MKKETLDDILDILTAMNAKVNRLDDGIELLGCWKDEYLPYSNYFSRISGFLEINSKNNQPIYFLNLKRVSILYIDGVVCHKDLLINLSYAAQIMIADEAQHPDFLKNINKVHYISIRNSIQHPDFLRNLNDINDLHIQYGKQHPDFLKQLFELSNLALYGEEQDVNFLRNIKNIYILTLDSKQHPQFLNNLERLNELKISNEEQHPDFLNKIKYLSGLFLYNNKNDKSFLRNLKALQLLFINGNIEDNEFIQNVECIGSIESPHKVNVDIKFVGSQFNDRGSLYKESKKNPPKPYVYIDNILSIVLNNRIVNGVEILLTNRVGFYENEYIGIFDGVTAHGSSISEVLDDIEYKKSIRNISQYKDYDVDKKIPYDEAIIMYKVITGACSHGIKKFVENISIKNEYTIKEIIDITNGQYGNLEFKRFFFNNH